MGAFLNALSAGNQQRTYKAAYLAGNNNKITGAAIWSYLALLGGLRPVAGYF